MTTSSVVPDPERSKGDINAVCSVDRLYGSQNRQSRCAIQRSDWWKGKSLPVGLHIAMRLNITIPRIPD